MFDTLGQNISGPYSFYFLGYYRSIIRRLSLQPSLPFDSLQCCPRRYHPICDRPTGGVSGLLYKSIWNWIDTKRFNFYLKTFTVIPRPVCTVMDWFSGRLVNSVTSRSILHKVSLLEQTIGKSQTLRRLKQNTGHIATTWP